MRVEFSKAVVAVALGSALVVGTGLVRAQQAPAAQQAKPDWKDRQEYDLFQLIEKETDPQKKLDLLKQWNDKYPSTAFQELRLGKYLETYLANKDAAKLYETAKALMQLNPKSFQGLYWTSILTISLQQTSTEALKTAESAANGLRGILDEFFAPDKRPSTTPEDAWKKARTDSDALAHRTLGWIAMQRKNNEEAEKRFRQDLQINPADAEASYWLGTVIIAQKKPEKQSEALFHFARAAAYDGPGGLQPAARKTVLDYVTNTYTKFHGKDPEGLQQLLALAKSQPFPPPDFKILSEAEVAALNEAELAKKDPQLAFWLKLKTALAGEEGQQYFDGSMKGALVPPEGQAAFKGTVISQEPVKAPKTVVLGLSNANTPEVTLKFENALPGPADPGTVVEFRGVATALSKAPFMLTFDVERKDLTGWPAPVKKTPTKKAPGRKKK